MKAALCALPLALLTLAGCSKPNEYNPSADVAGADMFKAVCADCHQADDDGNLFKLSGDTATTTGLAKKINEGGLMMTSFPNIQGDALNNLTTYVLENSAKE